MKRIASIALIIGVAFGMSACDTTSTNDCGNIHRGGSPAVNYAPCNY